VRGRSSAGERLLCKQGVIGSIPIASKVKGVLALGLEGFRKTPF
jgi:hypothetical protein